MRRVLARLSAVVLALAGLAACTAPGDDDSSAARRRDRAGQGQGDQRGRDPRLARYPVRRGAGRRPALAAPAGARRLGRGPQRFEVRPHLPPDQLPGPGADRLNAAGQLRRGLPLPQRERPEGRRRPAGDGLAARRRVRRRHRRSVPGQLTGDGQARRGPGDPQLPPRQARLLRPPVPRGGRSQLRPARPGGRAGLGAGQHRGLRRRPRQRHHLRPVGGRDLRQRADDLAGRGWPVRQGHLAVGARQGAVDLAGRGTGGRRAVPARPGRRRAAGRSTRTVSLAHRRTYSPATCRSSTR